MNVDHLRRAQYTEQDLIDACAFIIPTTHDMIKAHIGMPEIVKQAALECFCKNVPHFGTMTQIWAGKIVQQALRDLYSKDGQFFYHEEY